MSSRRLWRATVLAAAMLAVTCSNPAEPTPGAAEFTIDVSGERFVLRLTDPGTIQLAEDNRQGRNSRFPLGPLRAGNGGFNAPWTWHMDPAATRFVELAIEVCDGRPSYVERNQADYSTYCPWGARVVGRR
jgi:hypothetical protein